MTSIPTQDRAGENRSLARVSRAAGTDPGRTGASSPYPPQGELARTPSPVTRAAARGRGGAQIPAGGALGTADASPAGSKAGAAAGREAYALARRKAQARRPADPQQAAGLARPFEHHHEQEGGAQCPSARVVQRPDSAGL